jgi:hypothetical protein
MRKNKTLEQLNDPIGSAIAPAVPWKESCGKKRRRVICRDRSAGAPYKARTKAIRRGR